MQERKKSNINTEWINDFISKYSYLYFEPESLAGIKGIYNNCYQSLSLTEESRKSRLEEVGITKLSATHYMTEDTVVKELVSKGIFNKDSLAWKAGKLKWDEKHKIAYHGFESKDKMSYINGYGSPINIKCFNEYSRKLMDNKESIVKDLSVLENLTDKDKWIEEWKVFYEKHLQEYNPPTNIGPVYIINALFFLSEGRIPIYDAFAHKAVRALALDIKPYQVFLGSNPDKKDAKGVATMYCEYMLLLKKVFNGCVCTNGENMFISRELDRALWVFGHVSEKPQTTQEVD